MTYGYGAWRNEVTELTVLPGPIVLEVPQNTTILDALVTQGYTYRYGCKRGGCGVCKVDVLSGDIQHNRTVAAAVLSQEEFDSGTRLSCRAVLSTPATIAMRDDSLRAVFVRAFSQVQADQREDQGKMS